MPSPRTLLPWLLGGTIGAAGILQGLHWRSTGGGGRDSGLREQLATANEENHRLRRENESLRSLAQGGGELAVPAEFIARVEKEFGLRYLSSPVLHRLASEELQDRIVASLESRHGPSGMDDRDQVYKLIGWLRPDDNLLAQLVAVRAVGAIGWFDDVTGEGWVTERFVPENIPDQAALVRLLARILFHQHFPPPPAHPGDDAARAREALHAGAAAGAEARFYADNARGIGFMPMKENAAAVQLFSSLPTFLQGVVTFPSTDGKGFADSLHVRGNGPFLDVFRNPPQTTRAIMLPGSPVDRPEPLVMPSLREDPFLTESAGQLGLRLWLAPVVGDEAASELAVSWKNDSYAFFPDGTSSTGVLWEIELDSAEAAGKLEAAAKRMLTVLPKVDPEGSPRHLLVARPFPDRVRFANTADAATAASLEAK